jgi:hypothetical protein
MHDAQVWLVKAIVAHSPVAALMRTAWGWPIAESLHFLGLTLLIGTIGAFDLRLLGIGARIPIGAMHRLIPFGIAGFVLNATTGAMFVLTEPDQYIYNVSFHFKLLFLLIAGVNAGSFYLTSYRDLCGEPPAYRAPARAKAIAAISLCAWMCVITCGRLLTFFRPGPCAGTQSSWLLSCDPN